MGKRINSVSAVLILLYPFAVYYSVDYAETWQLAAVLALLLLLRQLGGGPAKPKGHWLLTGALMLYCGFAILHNNPVTLRFYPVLMNLGLLAIFGASLYFPPPVIERLARLQHPDLPPEGVLYTRKVTCIWIVFFLVNGLMAAATAIWCSFSVWSLYNGLIAYILIGLLMAIEYRVRIRTQSYVR
jgi:uncharacterized membrane protein